MNESNADSPRQDELSRLIAQYLEDEQLGKSPKREEMLRQNPDVANDLRSFFANHDQMLATNDPDIKDSAAPNGSTLASPSLGAVKATTFCWPKLLRAMRPTRGTAWAVASMIVSGLSGFLTWAVLEGRIVTRPTNPVGAEFVFPTYILATLAAALLSFMGIGFGAIALARVRSGKRLEEVALWTGIGLASFALVVLTIFWIREVAPTSESLRNLILPQVVKISFKEESVR